MAYGFDVLYCSNFSGLLKSLGLYFQIRDDYINLSDSKVWPG